MLRVHCMLGVHLYLVTAEGLQIATQRSKCACDNVDVQDRRFCGGERIQGQ